MYLISLIAMYMVVHTSPVHAASYAEFYSIEDLTDLSHDVLSGTVLDIVPNMENNLIVSTITVQISHNYVGNKQNTVSFKMVGGEMNGLRLSVPGAPIFEKGQQILLFLDHEHVVGFGQGAFSIEDGKTATRNLSNEIPEVENTINVQKQLPDETSARSCLEVKVWEDYGEDWSMRSIEVNHLAKEEYKAYPITLLANMEYQFLACTDEKAHGVFISLFDKEGNVLQEVEEDGREATLVWKNTNTQEVFLSVQTMSDDPTVSQIGTSVGILYR